MFGIPWGANATGLKSGRKGFVLLTTSSGGCSLAKGLVDAGHSLLKVGVGHSKSGSRPTASIMKSEVTEIVRTTQVEEIDLNSEEELLSFLSSGDHDFAVIAWPKLLSTAAIEAGSGKIIGTHPTPVPLGRGRHPFHWMQVLGIRETKLTAFWINEGVDSGRVVAQTRYRINPYRHAAHTKLRAERKMRSLGFLLGIRFLRNLPVGKVQNYHPGTYFRKRSEADCHLDFRMTASAIVKHVRSFSHPWPLATALIAGSSFRIEEARFSPLALLNNRYRWSTFGTVLKKKGANWVLIRCYQGAVWLRLQISSESPVELG